MKFKSAPWAYILVALLALGTEKSNAQNRNEIVFPQQNQQGGFGASAQGPFGATGGPGIGRGQLGQSQTGATGRAGNQGRQGTNFGQPAVGGQDGFVGTDAEQIRNQRNNNPRARRRAMFDFAVESLNEMRESSRRDRSNRNRKPPVRVKLRPLFAVPQPSGTQLTSQVRTQFNRALPTTVGAAQISLDGGTATIQGTVKSDYDKRLAAKMLSLQPGILSVENRLTVEPSLEAPLLVPAR